MSPILALARSVCNELPALSEKAPVEQRAYDTGQNKVKYPSKNDVLLLF
jgi:hypothetical protein